MFLVGPLLIQAGWPKAGVVFKPAHHRFSDFI